MDILCSTLKDKMRGSISPNIISRQPPLMFRVDRDGAFDDHTLEVHKTMALENYHSPGPHYSLSFWAAAAGFVATINIVSIILEDIWQFIFSWRRLPVPIVPRTVRVYEVVFNSIREFKSSLVRSIRFVVLTFSWGVFSGWGVHVVGGSILSCPTFAEAYVRY